MDKDQAVDVLMACDQATLAETAYFMHENQYGCHGTFLFKYTVPEIVNWILCHYDWDHDSQCWTSIEPFEDDVPTEIVHWPTTEEGRTLH